MNCPNCGTNNLDNATVCANCGRSLSAGAQSYVPPPSPAQTAYPPSSSPAAPAPQLPGSVLVYLIVSALMLLCCCNPFALVPLVFAIMAMTRKSAGDYAGMDVNARRTAMWFWIAIGALIVWYLVFFGLLGGSAILEEIRRNMQQ